MDSKFNESVRTYKERLLRIRENQRHTLPLPQGYQEVPSRDGKRMRLATKPTTNPDPAESEATMATRRGDSTVFTQYPRGPGGTVVHTASLCRLSPGVFLNKEIINIAMRLAYDQHIQGARRNVVQVCDSYTYAQLTRGTTAKHLKETTDTLQRNFARVAGYKRGNMFGQKEATVMAIEEDQHWFLVAGFVQTTPEGKTAHLALMDSLPGEPRWHTLDVLSGLLRHLFGEIIISRESWDMARHTTRRGKKNRCGTHTGDNGNKLSDNRHTNNGYGTYPTTNNRHDGGQPQQQ